MVAKGAEKGSQKESKIVEKGAKNGSLTILLLLNNSAIDTFGALVSVSAICLLGLASPGPPSVIEGAGLAPVPHTADASHSPRLPTGNKYLDAGRKPASSCEFQHAP